ncbi:MAG: hypothetical protein H6671_04395 [Anaerolineaceae bacterium]|nr:hypothetical protein [Anaerolineaceae bacterium]
MTQRPQRKSPRLQGYDYAQAGAYFVTICTHERAHLFGEVIDGVMILSRAGEIAEERWLALPNHHEGIELDVFVVMPNHVHGIIVLTGIVGTGPALSGHHAADNAGVVPTLGTVIGSYKSGVTRRIREMQKQPDLRVWQARYHDHIIRNETDLNRIREYTINNPARWQQDIFYGL